MEARIKDRLTVAVAISAAAAVVLFLCIFYHGHDPATEASPKCLFRLLTGFDCPGCGSQRAFHALLNGDISSAWSFNPFVFFAVPSAIFFFIVEYGKKRWPHFHAKATSPVVIAAVLASILFWWIGRNI